MKQPQIKNLGFDQAGPKPVPLQQLTVSWHGSDFKIILLPSKNYKADTNNILTRSFGLPQLPPL
jgi:hypothetical protein